MQELLYGGYASARQAIEARLLVSFTPEVKGTIAELFARNYATQKVEFIDDTFWLMSRFLARSDQGRYGPMIKEIAARSADKRIKKLSAMIDPAAVDAASAYVPVTVRLEEKRLAYPPFYPESTFIGPVDGCVILNYVDDIGWHVFSKDLEPLAYEDVMPYRRYAPAFGLPDDTSLALTQLLSGDIAAMRMSAIAMHRLETPPPQYLDAAAEMLLRDHAMMKGDERVDAHAWLCNLLAERGGIRYRQVIVTVQKNATDLKLSKFAGQPVLNMKVPAPRYVAGSVALDELARKYPSPYVGFAKTP